MSESGTPDPKIKVVAKVPDVPPAPKEPPTEPLAAPPTEPPEGDPPGDNKWDDETKTYIQSLRKENAKYRTANKKLQTGFETLEGKVNKISAAVTGKDTPADDPNVVLEQVKEENENLAAENAIYQSALEFGIPSDKVPYFKFLVSEKLNTMGDDEDELDVSPIAEQVLKMGGSPPTSPGATTGTTPPKTGPATPPGEITVKQFREMGYLEKSKLQRTDPTKYERLKTQALQT